jgi:SNF2 family DNA or RNA helicase
VAIEAITRASTAGRAGFLLADDVGLGKTLSTWEAVRRMPKVSTVLIVCPLAVVPHWRRTIASQGDDGRRIIVMNYERLGKLFQLTPKARKKV